jgi:hypothetical protein
MSSIRTPLFDKSEKKLCRSSRESTARHRTRPPRRPCERPAGHCGRQCCTDLRGENQAPLSSPPARRTRRRLKTALSTHLTARGRARFNPRAPLPARRPSATAPTTPRSPPAARGPAPWTPPGPSGRGPGSKPPAARGSAHGPRRSGRPTAPTRGYQLSQTMPVSRYGGAKLQVRYQHVRTPLPATKALTGKYVATTPSRSRLGLNCAGLESCAHAQMGCAYTDSHVGDHRRSTVPSTSSVADAPTRRSTLQSNPSFSAFRMIHVNGWPVGSRTLFRYSEWRPSSKPRTRRLRPISRNPPGSIKSGGTPGEASG